MTTQYYAATSMDGFLADERGGLDWLLQFGAGTGYEEFLAGVGAIIMGAETYRWLLGHGEIDLARPETWPYTQPTWLLTHGTPPLPAGTDIHLVYGDVAAVHRQALEAAGTRNVWIVGGGDVAGQFLTLGLIDELIFTIAPVTLVRGVPAIPLNTAEQPFHLIGARADGPFATLTYRVA